MVAAHPDDEILGCGGTIIKHVQAGDEVHILIMADGVTSRSYVPGGVRGKELSEDKKAIKRRKQEFIAATQIMGIAKGNIDYYDLPDQRLDAFPLLDIIKIIEQVAREIRPEVVYTHHWGDLNKDHRVCFEATLTAFRPRLKKKIEIFCFEIPGNMNLLQPKGFYKFNPDRFVDISGFMQQKIEALKAYKSELRDYPQPISVQYVKNLARRKIHGQKYKFVEAFESVKF